MTRLRVGRARAGMTLVEVVICCGIIALLAGLALPTVLRARESSRRVACQDRVRQLCMSAIGYAGQVGYLPPGPRDLRAGANQGRNGWTWSVFVLPYLGEEAEWDRASQAVLAQPDISANPPHTGNSSTVRMLICPSEWRLDRPRKARDGSVSAFASYMGVMGSHPTDGRLLGQADGVMTEGFPPVRLTDISDGASNTVMVGERPPSDLFDAGRWYRPFLERGDGPDGAMHVRSATYHDGPICVAITTSGLIEFGPGRPSNPCDKYHFWSLHRQGANFGFADGAVRFLKYSARDRLPSLASRNGGEPPWHE